MSWEYAKLGDVSDMLVGFSFKSKDFIDASEQGVKLVRGDNVQQGFIRWGDKVKKWREDEYESLSRFQLQKDDVILAMDRPIVGGGLKIAWIKEQDIPSLLVQRVTRIRGKFGLALTNFIRYALSSPDFIAHIEKITTGANIPHISSKDIANFEFRLPSLTEQEKIIGLILTYDDLIETNQRRIALLEESARLLYREWFVNLRFPGYELVEFVDGLPSGWKRESLSSVANFINGFAFKPSHLQEDGLPIVKIPELRDGISSKTPRNPGDVVPVRNKIDSGDLLFSWSATLLVNEWNEGPALLNQHLFKVIPIISHSKRFLRFAIEESIPALLGHSVGATMQHIRKSALDDHVILVPDEAVRLQFSDLVDPIMDQVSTLNSQISLLEKARDEILPKLMSGEIQV